MSSSISLEYFRSQFASGTSGVTADGGYYITLTNRTGAGSVKGTIVAASTAYDNAVEIAPANTQMPVGVIYENSVADGSPVKVVISGKASVLLRNGEAATRGYWCGVSPTAGRMYQASTPPTDTAHSREIGHSLESKASGTDVLAAVVLHFN